MSSAQSTPTFRISELGAQAGSTVTVNGWVTHTRSSGKVAFIVMRDGTGILQCVVVKTQVSPEVWERFGALTLETSITVTGEVRADARAPGGVEMGVTDLVIVGESPLRSPMAAVSSGVSTRRKPRS